MKIVLALMAEELCTCDLAKIANLSISAVSHQLRLLRDRKIVAYRREGRNVFYRIEDDHVREVVELALAHLQENSRGRGAVGDLGAEKPSGGSRSRRGRR